MKKIIYKTIGLTDIFNPDTNEIEQKEIFVTVKLDYSSESIKKALKDSYNGEYTIEEEPDDRPLDEIRADKLEELSASCNAAITAGMDVETTKGTEHFSLQETDQINLTTAYNAVQTGASGYPYHADGQLCKMYPAADIIAISEAATAHKLYHTTYCNHLMAWARRAETVDERSGIIYGAELPEDLAANMAEVMSNAAAV